MVKIEFEKETKYGVYRDALYLPADHGMTEDQIEAIKQERLDNWIYIVENPPQSVEEQIDVLLEEGQTEVLSEEVLTEALSEEQIESQPTE